MARRRMIDPDIWFNEKFNKLSDTGRLLFIGIFSNADDDGRLKASPKYLKAHIFPYDHEDKTSEQIKELRDQCEKAELINIYSQNGTEYLYLPGWSEHQQIRKDTYHKSDLPSPDGQLALNNPPVTTPLQPRNGDVTPPLPNQSNQSSLVKSNQSSIINNAREGYKDVLNNENDLTDRLTTDLTEAFAGGRRPVWIMEEIVKKLWQDAGMDLKKLPFESIYSTLEKYKPPIIALALAKLMKHIDGKKKPGNYYAAILKEKAGER